jgi:hypothetical protein
MAEVCSPAMYVSPYKTAWHHNPEDHNLNSHHPENFWTSVDNDLLSDGSWLLMFWVLAE